MSSRFISQALDHRNKLDELSACITQKIIFLLGYRWTVRLRSTINIA